MLSTWQVLNSPTPVKGGTMLILDYVPLKFQLNKQLPDLSLLALLLLTCIQIYLTPSNNIILITPSLEFSLWNYNIPEDMHPKQNIPDLILIKNNRDSSADTRNC